MFEAKTHFSQLCDQVCRSGQPLLVERRGKAVVMITPVDSSKLRDEEDILSAWKRYSSEHPEDDSDFPDVSKMRTNKDASPFDES